MKTVVGIPARLGSSRFPGKPLKDICGKPMIEHVFRRCELSDMIDYAFIATCDEEIKKWAEKAGCRVVMTSPDIERPGLRVAEACKGLGLNDDDIVVIVQGDEPLVHPDMMNVAIQPLLEDDNVFCVNLGADMTEDQWQDPNEIKMVCDKNMNALYMSRSPIPSRVHPEKPFIGPRWRQVCIMPFRKKSLLQFQEMAPCPLEKAESIEMLRAIEHGLIVRIVKSPSLSKSVDNEADRLEVEKIMKNDLIYEKHGF